MTVIATAMAMAPAFCLALMIKVVITQMKDGELAAVNAHQAERIEDLCAARDRANAAKSNVLAVISHELRLPMNGMVSAAQSLDTIGL